jgi:hypothetical protein
MLLLPRPTLTSISPRNLFLRQMIQAISTKQHTKLKQTKILIRTTILVGWMFVPGVQKTVKVTTLISTNRHVSLPVASSDFKSLSDTLKVNSAALAQVPFGGKK